MRFLEGKDGRMTLNHQILIVEADPKERVALRKLVEDRGYHTTTARDGNEARKKLIENEFPLIIANYTTPGLTGRELLVRARRYRPL